MRRLLDTVLGAAILVAVAVDAIVNDPTKKKERKR
jgi:hypothetical protein